ncbi:Oidioi.mRNA.OKI2018_I69.XSR.g14230.t1.cds [Oikopleura dioica]|uniref:GATOR complex protein NPRL3 n=1 Tax=Oikopleura dioica TaxID=34765 RepID=A0ABN7SGF4_OIKDI|nr:Oidioi.mRNA.OKI2018_I69.XSR.g14230.t1.cds [Oikopleura dioica]
MCDGPLGIFIATDGQWLASQPLFSYLATDDVAASAKNVSRMNSVSEFGLANLSAFNSLRRTNSGAGETRPKSIEEQLVNLKGLPLATLLLNEFSDKENGIRAPSNIKVNGLRYVGWPTRVQNNAEKKHITGFNLVFAIKASCDQEVGQRYQQISRHISTAIVAEEKRNGFLTSEMKKWHSYQQSLQGHDGLEVQASGKISDLYKKTLDKSILGQQLQKCFRILTKRDMSRDIFIGQIRIGITINNASQVIHRLDLDSNDMIQPFHTLILLSEFAKDGEGIELPNDSSATLFRMIKKIQSNRNLMDTQHESDVLLIHLQEVAAHLVQQGLAKLIYPIDKRARYVLNREFDFILLEKDEKKRSRDKRFKPTALVEEFEQFKQIYMHGCSITFIEVLQMFKASTSVKKIIAKVCNYMHNMETAEETVFSLMRWLILKNIVTRQHFLLYFLPPPSEELEQQAASSPSSNDTPESDQKIAFSDLPSFLTLHQKIYVAQK